MTAEVVVMNPLAVALAADSAVSVAKGKIYASAEKLFQLSLSAPVGIMVFGNANFLEVPWETLVKSYRRERGRLVLATVEDYAEDFVSFLRSRRSLFPLPVQRQNALQLVEALYDHLANRIYARLRKATTAAKAISTSDVRTLVRECVARLAKEIADTKRFRNAPRRLESQVVRTLGSQIDRRRRDIFQNLPMAPATRQQIRRLAVDALIRAFFGPMRSGIVVAGFGSREYMPAMIPDLLT